MNGMRPPQIPRSTISRPLSAPVVRGSRRGSVRRAGAVRGCACCSSHAARATRGATRTSTPPRKPHHPCKRPDSGSKPGAPRPHRDWTLAEAALRMTRRARAREGHRLDRIRRYVPPGLHPGAGPPHVRAPLSRAPLAGRCAAGYDRAMPDRLHFTDSDEANELIATDPMALLIGFALDQQVSVQKAFSGPLAIRERRGNARRCHPGRHRPRAGVSRAARHPPLPRLDGAPGPGPGRPHPRPLRRRRRARLDRRRRLRRAARQPGGASGFRRDEDQGARARCWPSASASLRPRTSCRRHPTLGDVDSAQALADYQAAKRVHKAEWTKMKAGAAG